PATRRAPTRSRGCPAPAGGRRNLRSSATPRGPCRAASGAPFPSQNSRLLVREAMRAAGISRTPNGPKKPDLREGALKGGMRNQSGTRAYADRRSSVDRVRAERVRAERFTPFLFGSCLFHHSGEESIIPATLLLSAEQGLLKCSVGQSILLIA